MNVQDVHKAHILAAESYLRGFRRAFQEIDRPLDLMACDRHYLDQGIDRPMCCGVWLDWKEADQCS